MAIGRIVAYEIVLLDAMIINNFAEAGAHRPLVEYLGSSIATTTIVAAEVSDEAYVNEPRRHILGAIEASGVMIEPTRPELRRIDAMATPAVEGGRVRDRGEASLVVCAGAIDDSKVIVLDDREGIALVEANRIDVATGRRLLAEMILVGVADAGHSWRMASRCFGVRDRRKHDAQLERSLGRLRQELDES